MKDDANAYDVGAADEVPPFVDEEVLRESHAMLRRAAEKANHKMRKTIEELQEEKRLHELIDDYDFDGLDEDDEEDNKE